MAIFDTSRQQGGGAIRPSSTQVSPSAGAANSKDALAIGLIGKVFEGGVNLYQQNQESEAYEGIYRQLDSIDQARQAGDITAVQARRQKDKLRGESLIAYPSLKDGINGIMTNNQEFQFKAQRNLEQQDPDAGLTDLQKKQKYDPVGFSLFSSGVITHDELMSDSPSEDTLRYRNSATSYAQKDIMYSSEIQRIDYETKKLSFQEKKDSATAKKLANQRTQLVTDKVNDTVTTTLNMLPSTYRKSDELYNQGAAGAAEAVRSLEDAKFILKQTVSQAASQDSKTYKDFEYMTEAAIMDIDNRISFYQGTSEVKTLEALNKQSKARRENRSIIVNGDSDTNSRNNRSNSSNLIVGTDMQSNPLYGQIIRGDVPQFSKDELNTKAYFNELNVAVTGYNGGNTLDKEGVREQFIPVVREGQLQIPLMNNKTLNNFTTVFANPSSAQLMDDSNMTDADRQVWLDVITTKHLPAVMEYVSDDTVTPVFQNGGVHFIGDDAERVAKLNADSSKRKAVSNTILAISNLSRSTPESVIQKLVKPNQDIPE